MKRSYSSRYSATSRRAAPAARRAFTANGRLLTSRRARLGRRQPLPELRTHHADVSVGAVTNNIAGSVVALTAIDQGTAVTQRAGLKLQVEKIRLRLQALGAGNTAGGAPSGVLRIVIWVADVRRMLSSLDTIIDPNASPQMYGGWNVSNAGSYKILYDEILPVNSLQNQVGTGSYAQVSVTRDVTLRVNKELRYHDQSPYNDSDKNCIFLGFIASEPNYIQTKGSAFVTFRDI